MRIVISGAVLAALLAGAVAAQTPAYKPPAAPPLDDKRLAISTLVREDIFAGILDKDMTSFARGEANIETLIATRPASDKPGLLSWKGAAVLYRAALANEAGKKADYARLNKQAMALFAEAKATGPVDPTVAAVNGASALLFADRLAKPDRAAAWTVAYDNYQDIWKAQGAFADKLPPHIRGELMSGLVMSAQRTGRQAEADAQLDKMLVLMKGTPYEATAQAWKADPKSVSTMLACKSCHDAGRLAPTLANLNKAPV